MDDHITISNLELLARIGVSTEEREKPQRLTASIILHPLHPFERRERDAVRHRVLALDLDRSRHTHRPHPARRA